MVAAVITSVYSKVDLSLNIISLECIDQTAVGNAAEAGVYPVDIQNLWVLCSGVGETVNFPSMDIGDIFILTL